MSGATLPAIWCMYRRALREFVALGPPVVIVPLTVPLFMLLVYPRVFSAVIDGTATADIDLPGFGADGSYLQYVAPATMVMAALLSSGSAAIGVAVERQIGFYDRMQITPLGPVVSQIGRRCADATRIAAFALLLSVVAHLNGTPVSNWPLGLAVSLTLVAALGVAYGGLAFALCLSSGSAEATQAITPLFFPVLFTSTAFLPVDLMPSWLAPIAEANPLSAVCDTVRWSFLGRVDGAALAHATLGIACLGGVTQLLIARAARRVANR